MSNVRVLKIESSLKKLTNCINKKTKKTKKQNKKQNVTKRNSGFIYWGLGTF